MKDTKITEEQFKRFCSGDITVKEYKDFEEKIRERVNYIVKKVLSKRWFDNDNKYSWYDYDTGCDDNGDWKDGKFDTGRYKERVSITGESWDFYPPYDYDTDFPTRWLWEDCEDEVKREIEEYKTQQLKEKSDKREKKIEEENYRKRLIKSILSKLTKEEITFFKCNIIKLKDDKKKKYEDPEHEDLDEEGD